MFVKNAQPKVKPDGSLTVATYSDGLGLNLVVTPGPDDKVYRSWLFRYRFAGRQKVLGQIGNLQSVGLAEARIAAQKYRDLLSQGIDPAVHNEQTRLAQERAEAATKITFKHCAECYLAIKRMEWRSEKTGNDWEAGMEAYVYPSIGRLPIKQVTKQDILAILKPIWTTKTVTAMRLPSLPTCARTPNWKTDLCT
jgi:hypothetical protein